MFEFNKKGKARLDDIIALLFLKKISSVMEFSVSKSYLFDIISTTLVR